MVLQKDPEIMPDDFLDFPDVFQDINTPVLFIAQNESDLVSKAIILDGHSTLLVYNQDSKDMNWIAYRDQGSYSYRPEKIGDGTILFPHHFYFEFEIELTDKIIKVAAEMGASAINAIVMPMNSIQPTDFIQTLNKRLNSSLSSILKQYNEDLDISIGSKMTIPKSAKSDIAFKLALLGVTLETIKILESKEIPKIEGKVVERIFEKKESAFVDQLKKEKEEEKERKKKVAQKTKDKREAVASKKKKKKKESKPKPIKVEMKTAPNPPPPRQKVRKPPGVGGPASGATIPKTMPKPSKAPGPSIKDTMPKPSKAPRPSKKDSMPPRASIPSAPKMKIEANEIMGDDMAFDEEVEEDMDELLPADIQKEKISDEKEIITKERFTNTSYFERMISNRSYKFVIEIASKELKSAASITSMISGEKASEKTGSFELEDLKSQIIIRPQIPGCLVVPAEVRVGAEEDVKAEFYVTPLVFKGEINATIQFLQNENIFHSIELKTKVITHRLSRWIAYISILASIIPYTFAFFLDENPVAYLDNLVSRYLPILIGFGYIIPLLITTVFGLSGGLLFWAKRPKTYHTSLSFPR